MPRLKRRQVPGVLSHVIVRFVDGHYLMDEVDGAREQYLTRLDGALHRSDWTLCFYALMGTHVHLGLVCGEQPLDTWARALHSGWAGWINRAGRRRGGRTRGPVLADRPKTLLVHEHRAPGFGAYLHNNPVRAGVVTTPEDCTWTSHRAYLGIDAPIAALDVARGLSFYGCTPSREGRARFHEFVYERRSHPRDPELSGATMTRVRRQTRELHGSAAELMTPAITVSGEASYPVRVSMANDCVCYSRTADEFLHAVAPFTGFEADSLRGPGRAPERARMRRAVVLAWRALGRRPSEICTALRISQPAASNVLARATSEDNHAAEVLLSRLGGMARL